MQVIKILGYNRTTYLTEVEMIVQDTGPAINTSVLPVPSLRFIETGSELALTLFGPQHLEK